jgi:hypothetical protein
VPNTGVVIDRFLLFSTLLLTLYKYLYYHTSEAPSNLHLESDSVVLYTEGCFFLLQQQAQAFIFRTGSLESITSNMRDLAGKQVLEKQTLRFICVHVCECGYVCRNINICTFVGWKKALLNSLSVYIYVLENREKRNIKY